MKITIELNSLEELKALQNMLDASETPADDEKVIHRTIPNTKVEDAFSPRTSSVLQNAGINTLKDLLPIKEKNIHGLKSVNNQMLNEINAFLRLQGVCLLK